MESAFLMSYSYFIFFFKQKTAYDMRISDWSSDVCSSDLAAPAAGTGFQHASLEPAGRHGDGDRNPQRLPEKRHHMRPDFRFARCIGDHRQRRTDRKSVV